MKIIRNKYIPFQGYKAINLFGVLFVKNNAKISDVDLNHEAIHTAQIRELLYLGFYLWYGVEWFIRLFMRGNAYKKISFEHEAYENDDNLSYLSARKCYTFLKYL